MRSRLGLAGNTLDVDGPTWERRDSGIGAGIDSYYEYLLKVLVAVKAVGLRDTEALFVIARGT